MDDDCIGTGETAKHQFQVGLLQISRMILNSFPGMLFLADDRVLPPCPVTAGVLRMHFELIPHAHGQLLKRMVKRFLLSLQKKF